MTHLREKIVNVVDGMQDETVDLTCKLVKYRTVSETGDDYLECTDFLSNELAEAGMEVRKIDVPKETLQDLWGKELEKSRRYIEVKKFSPRTIVLGEWSGTLGKPCLHINNHYDVMEGGSPFEATVKNGKIFGKGTTDPWAGNVSAIMAVQALRRAKVKLKGRLFLSATPDNHLGGESGAGYLVDRGYGKSDMVITCSPGGANTATLGYKGALWIEITTFGKTAHAGEDSEGINAIDKMMKVHRALYELDQEYVRKRIRSKWPTSPPECSRPTITMAAINATGLGVPDRCVMYVDRRINPEETVDKVKDEILKRIRTLEKKDKDLKVNIDFVHEVESSVTPKDSNLAKTLTKNIREILGARPKTLIWCYYQDFRFFRSKWKSQTVNYSPGLPKIYRGPSEYVPIRDLVTATKVLALTIADLLG
jgi:succinyl-diaminopimelate desuccinylase